MQSFRTELENPIVERDIFELEKKIRLFREGKMVEDKFKSLRLARGIYGQRQPGVQMVRIKLPYGKLTTRQLLKIADISDEYAIGNLHLTTRQDIQIHFVSLDKTPELWYKLEQDDITIREACGNTVRNITASPIAGIDSLEPFDITPYAQESFKYFLRNPVCQDMGRKFKIAFSSSEADTGFAYMHDLGFIPKIKEVNGVATKGFRVMIGGGLGAQPFLAKLAYDFLTVQEFIPFTEAVLRVFDRYGERSSRHKARLKYLIEKIGLEKFMELVYQEFTAVKAKNITFEFQEVKPVLPPLKEIPAITVQNKLAYEAWRKTNVFEQKQSGYFGVYIRVQTGDLPTGKARILADMVNAYAAEDLRVTVNQGLLIKFVRKEALPYVFSILERLDLALPGFDSTADITSCPGTDTCNLGISNSTGVTRELERVIQEEYPDLIYNQDLKIKISGCMNSCGQHSMANIGFHGSSMKSGKSVLPALQVLMGGGTLGNGEGRIAEKILKIPSKRAPELLRIILDNYEQLAQQGEAFNAFYDRMGKDYFYKLLKPLADLTSLTQEDFVDWNRDQQYSPAIGVGECAGVVIDLISTLLMEAEERLEMARGSFQEKVYADAIYHAYSAFVSAAKALLLGKDIACNTQIGILRDFDQNFSAGEFGLESDFQSLVLQINQQEPTLDFGTQYIQQATSFLQHAHQYKQAVSQETLV
ncbi:MAG: HEPN domain-containing protein [Chitinophagaceae bacterium]